MMALFLSLSFPELTRSRKLGTDEQSMLTLYLFRELSDFHVSTLHAISVIDLLHYLSYYLSLLAACWKKKKKRYMD